MVDNNNLLKKLNRRDLLQILLEQTKRIEDLEEQIIDYEKQLEMKKVSFTDVGNLAEASLQLTDIFKNAEEAISIYKSNIEDSLKNKERDFQEECQRIKEKIELEKEVKYQKRVLIVIERYKQTTESTKARMNIYLDGRRVDSNGNIIGEQTKQYEYLQDIRPFSLLNIPNEILSDMEKSISIIYTLYF